jgi:hypothetical protein
MRPLGVATYTSSALSRIKVIAREYNQFTVFAHRLGARIFKRGLASSNNARRKNTALLEGAVMITIIRIGEGATSEDRNTWMWHRDC